MSAPTTSAAAVEALARRAFAHHQAGELGPAEALYREILATAPDDVNALHLLGVLCLDTGRADEAAALLERAAGALAATGAADARHAALYNNFGNALRALGRPDEAARAYRRGLDLDPTLAELHANLAWVLLVQGEPLAAIAAYEASLARNPDNADCLCNLANCYAAACRDAEAAAAYRRALELCPDHADAAANLARLLVSLGRWDEARPVFLTVAGQLEQLARAHPGDAAPARRLAEAYLSADRADLELDAYGRAAALAPDDAEIRLAIGRLEHDRGGAAAAEAAYRAVLSLCPDHVEALARLAMLLLEGERHDEVITTCTHLLEVAPGHAGALYVLGAAQLAIEDLPAAIESYTRCLALRPDFAAAHYKLGMAHIAAGKPAEAIASLTTAAKLKPDDPMILQDLGNVLHAVGWTQEADACFRRALDLRPLVTWPAAGGRAAFAVLLLNAPGAGNTPADYLVGKADYDAHFLALLPGRDPDPAPLHACCDVVVNLISDVDKSRDFLPVVAELADRIGRPVINHPRLILQTDRESVAAKLAGIAGARVPRVLRVAGRDLAAPGGAERLAAFAYPFLVRLAGTHGGEDFELINDDAALAAFVGRRPEAAYYVSDYVDYRSPDGYFRKYRMVFVGDEVLPYHLAIADQWKVHHYRTEMESTAWMQHEEEAFLRQPQSVFGPAQMAALRAIRAEMGLDVFGIDCALDATGRVVVFEVNATMLIHGHNRALPYKTPYVARIKQAFDALLATVARGNQDQSRHV